MELLLHLTLYNLVASIFLYASLACNTRMWLHRMPPEVFAKVTGKTPQEKRFIIYFALPFLLWLFGYPLIYVLGQEYAFLADFLVFCAFFAGFAAWDTLVRPANLLQTHPQIFHHPGSERDDYSNMKYHQVIGVK